MTGSLSLGGVSIGLLCLFAQGNSRKCRSYRPQDHFDLRQAAAKFPTEPRPGRFASQIPRPRRGLFALPLGFRRCAGFFRKVCRATRPTLSAGSIAGQVWPHAERADDPRGRVAHTKIGCPVQALLGRAGTVTIDPTRRNGFPMSSDCAAFGGKERATQTAAQVMCS